MKNFFRKKQAPGEQAEQSDIGRPMIRTISRTVQVCITVQNGEEWHTVAYDHCILDSNHWFQEPRVPTTSNPETFRTVLRQFLINWQMGLYTD